MDKKQFFESFISVSSDDSGHLLASFEKIRGIFESIERNISDTALRGEFQKLYMEVLFRIWMFEEICNDGDMKYSKTTGVTGHALSGPLIIIYISQEVFFVNRSYCEASGLSPKEAQTLAKEGKLYESVYVGEDAKRAREGVSKLKAGRGYQNLELLMKHSNKRVIWSSYGGVWRDLDIRSGREITNMTNQTEFQESHYHGNIIDSAKIFKDMYAIIWQWSISPEDWENLRWITQFVSMFDFLWNHSGFLMEIVYLPIWKSSEKNTLRGKYNSLYAKFLGQSFIKWQNFEKILSSVYGKDNSKLFLHGKFEHIDSSKGVMFYTKNKYPVARVRWKHFICPYDLFPSQTAVFGIGILINKLTLWDSIRIIFKKLFGKKK